jgi:hypothetical protein
MATYFVLSGAVPISLTRNMLAVLVLANGLSVLSLGALAILGVAAVVRRLVFRR